MGIKILSIDGINDVKLAQLLEQLLSTIPGVNSVRINLLAQKLTLDTDDTRDMNQIVNEAISALRKNVPGITVGLKDVSKIPEPKPAPFSSRNNRYDDDDDDFLPDEPNSPYAAFDEYAEDYENEDSTTDNPPDEVPEEPRQNKLLALLEKWNLPDDTVIRLLEYTASVFFFLLSFLPVSSSVAIFFEVVSFLLCSFSLFFPFEKEWFSKFNISSVITFAVMASLLFTRDFRFTTLALLFSQAGNVISYFLYRGFDSEVEHTYNVSPEKVDRIREGVIEQIPITDIMPGTQLVIKPGDLFPFTGVVVEGSGQVETDILTGYPQYAEVKEEDTVECGDRNLENTLVIRVTKFQNDTTPVLIRKSLLSSKNIKTDSLLQVRKYTIIFTLIEFLVITGLSIWGWITDSPDFWRNLLAGLLVLCPCGITFSVRAIELSNMISAMKDGILLHSTSCFHILANIKTLILGFTGVLTDGVYHLQDILTMEGTDADYLLTVAAVIEQHSDHPIAQAIVKAYQEKFQTELVPDTCQMFETIAGYGVRAMYDNRIVLIGNERLMEDAEVEIPPRKIKQTCVYVSIGGDFVGVLLLNNTMKESAADLGRDLKEMGIIRTGILSGCDLTVLQDARNYIGGDEFYSVQSNSAKQQQVATLLSREEEKNALVYAGDLDHVALLAELCPTIMMGSDAVDKVYYAAQAIIPSNEPEKLKTLVQLSKNVQKSIMVNLAMFLIAKIALFVASIFYALPFYWIAICNTLLTVFVTYQAIKTLVQLPFFSEDETE